MVIIDKNTVVVFSSAELKDVLENDNGYTYIFFDDNITLTSGIGISSKKSRVTIDGTYNGVTYEYTDQKKLGTSDGIYVTNVLTENVTVKNLNVTGYNYYGIIYVPEASGYKNIVIEYSNITYVGPQISYNPVGTTRFIDSNITVKENYAAGNEVAECNKIEIGGNTTITHNSTGNSAFWFRNSDPSFSVLPGADVKFTSTSRELIFGVSNLKFTVGKNASFYITTYNGMAYGTYGTGTSLIDENATLSISKTNYSGSYATWYSYGTITVNKGAILNIINEYESITTSNYNISFMGSQSGLILNNPEKVVLYNKVANIINVQNTATFDFNFTRINLFNTLVSMNDKISRQTLPTYAWYKELGLSTISGTFTSSKTTITSNNYTESELQNLPSLDNFNIANKKILSVGTMLFSVNSLTENDLEMSGKTEEESSILIEYDDVSVVVDANELGEFTYSYLVELPIGTVIAFNCKRKNDVIYYTKKIQIVYSGELLISSATKKFEFETYAISQNPILCPRRDAVSIVITDSRVNSSDWKLYASINHELKSDAGEVLEKSLVFVDEQGVVNVLSDTPTLVYTGTNNGGNISTTTVEWEEGKGILLQLLGPLENNVMYSADIVWTLEE